MSVFLAICRFLLRLGVEVSFFFLSSSLSSSSTSAYVNFNHTKEPNQKHGNISVHTKWRLVHIIVELMSGCGWYNNDGNQPNIRLFNKSIYACSSNSGCPHNLPSCQKQVNEPNKLLMFVHSYLYCWTASDSIGHSRKKHGYEHGNEHGTFPWIAKMLLVSCAEKPFNAFENGLTLFSFDLHVHSPSFLGRALAIFGWVGAHHTK